MSMLPFRVPMSEPDWLTGSDPLALLRLGGEKASERKLRLFACACCRRNWPSLSDARSRRAVETAEAFADGGCRNWEREAAHVSAMVAARGALPGPETQAAIQAARAIQRSFNVLVAQTFAAETVEPADRAALCHLIRDLFDNPFRPAIIDTAWLAWNDATVVNLARGIYDERRWSGLPILADALEEAGCADPILLAHCRQPGTHQRGCWLVDGILGRT